MSFKKYNFENSDFKRELEEMGVLIDYDYINGDKTKPKVLVKKESVEDVKSLINNFVNYRFVDSYSGCSEIYFRVEKNTMAGH